jgi:hypothetical protein
VISFLHKSKCYWLGYFRSKIVEISGFSKLAKVRLRNRLFKHGPTFFINVHMHNLLGLGCSHSTSISDVWDSFVSWRNLILNMYNISVIECLDFINRRVTIPISYTCSIQKVNMLLCKWHWEHTVYFLMIFFAFKLLCLQYICIYILRARTYARTYARTTKHILTFFERKKHSRSPKVTWL